MYSSSSDSDSDFEDDLNMLLLCELTRRQRKERRFWIHPINRRRDEAGEYHSLVQELEADQDRFFMYFRMYKNQFEEIHSMIQSDIKKMDTAFRQSIGTKEKLAVCLRYLATGKSFRSIGFSYRLGFATVRIIVEDVCKAIWRNMSPKVMPPPTLEQWTQISQDFNTFWNFPNCIGALDGKHVNIKCPINAGSTFYNYKQQHSIVLLALVDARYKFVMIDVGAYGRNSDGGIYENSLMARLIQQKALNLPEDKPLKANAPPMPHVIVADAAFPLKPYMLKPYSKPNLVNNDANKIYNLRLSRARRIVENAFGILRARWRVYQGPLQVQPKMVDNIILASCCLHNYLGAQITEAERAQLDGTEHSNNTQQAFVDLDPIRRNPTQAAIYARETFKEYFVSLEGQIPWQWDSIRRGRY